MDYFKELVIIIMSSILVNNYVLSQTLGIGLTFAAPGAVILYFIEKRAGKKRIKPLELLCLAVCALFAFALGMALWLG